MIIVSYMVCASVPILFSFICVINVFFTFVTLFAKLQVHCVMFTRLSSKTFVNVPRITVIRYFINLIDVLLVVMGIQQISAVAGNNFISLNHGLLP